MDIPPGTTSFTLDVQAVDDTGAPLTGKVAADFPALEYSLGSRTANAAFPALSDLASLTAAHTPGGVKEKGGGWYRLDCPDAMVATDGTHPRIIGEAADFHLLHDSLSVSGVMADIQQQVGRIGAGKVVLRSPVTDGGKHLIMVRGDDYSAAAGQPLDWTDEGGNWPDLTDATITLTIRGAPADGVDGSILMQKVGSVITPTGDDKTVRVEPSSADTSALAPVSKGNVFDVQATLSNGRIVTLVLGVTTILRDATI
jgi:hypothetical protein